MKKIAILLLLMPIFGFTQSQEDIYKVKLDSLLNIVESSNYEGVGHESASQYLSITNLSFVTGDPEQSTLYLDKSIKASESIKEDTLLLKYYVRLTGSLVSYLAEYDKASVYIDKSIALGKELNDSSTVAYQYMIKGYNEGITGRDDRTRQSFEDGLLYVPRPSTIRANLLSRLCEQNFELGDFEKGRYYLNEVEKSSEFIEKHQLQSLKLSDFESRGEYEKGAELVTEMIVDADSVQNFRRVSYFYAIKTQLLVKAKNYNDAIKAGLKGYDITATKNLDKEKHDVLIMLIPAFDSIADHKNSLIYSRKLWELEKQKIADKEQNEQLRKDNEEGKVLLLEKELESNQKSAEIEQKKQEQYYLYGGIGIFVFISFLALRAYRQKRKDNEIINKQKEVLLIQKQDVEQAHKEIKDSINYSERIQRSFLASDSLLEDNLKDHFIFFKPKEMVSGDFYWATKLISDKFLLVNADSTGHGVPGAIMSILNITSLEKSVDKGLTEPADIFNDTRKTIIDRLKKDGSSEGGKDGMDATILSIDYKTNKLKYAAAQNPIWIVRFIDGESTLIQIKPEKMPVGKHDNDNVPFVGGEIDVQKGDMIYTMTDGFQDQFGGKKNKKFKSRPFKDFIVSIAHLPMSDQKNKLANTFTDWMGDFEQVDDVCIIGVKM